MELISNKLECDCLTEEELRELLADLPNIIKELKEENDDPEITN